MYIVTDQQDYESADIFSAHTEEADAIKAAEAIVAARVDAWDIPKARQDIMEAGSMGPAVRPIAVWRCYDNYTTTVWELVMA